MSKFGKSMGALALVALGAVFAAQAKKTETLTLNSIDPAPTGLMQVTTQRTPSDKYPQLVSAQPLSRVNATDAQGHSVTVLAPVRTVNSF